MSVSKMKLKDNRDEKPENLKESKFDFCKKKGILGIGWVNHGKSANATTTEKEIGYERAKNSFFPLKINDLVWVVKYKWIYLLAVLAIAGITITFFAVNSAHSRYEKEIEVSLANKIFLSSGQILKFDNKGKYRYGWISEKENKITDIDYYDWENYDVKISLFGKVYFIDEYSDKHKIDFDENNDIISIGDGERITNEFKSKIDDYYLKLDEIKKAKSYLPNSVKMHTRVFKVFPQINSWEKTVERDGLVLYKNPYNSKDSYVYSNVDSGTSTLRINDSGKSAVFFVNDYGKISLSDSGTLTKNKYNELIALAFDEAPDNLKISDLEIFKKLAEVTEDPHPYIKDAVRSRKYVAIYKGVRYEVTENYTKEGAYNGYSFVIKID